MKTVRLDYGYETNHLHDTHISSAFVMIEDNLELPCGLCSCLILSMSFCAVVLGSGDSIVTCGECMIVMIY